MARGRSDGWNGRSFSSLCHSAIASKCGFGHSTDPLFPICKLETTPFTPSWPSCSNEAAALHLLLKAQMLVRSPCLPVMQAITDEMRLFFFFFFFQNYGRIQSNKYQKTSSIKFLAPAWNHTILLSETGLPYENNKSYILMGALFFSPRTFRFLMLCHQAPH